MADAELQETIQHRFPRFLAAGVDYNDAHTMLSKVSRMDQWLSVWEEMGHTHETMGEAALADDWIKA